MRILDITLKDLTQILRDRRALLFLVVMPVAFTLFMGFASQDRSKDVITDNRPVIAWVDADPDGILGKSLAAKLEKSTTVRLENMDEAAALEAVRKGKVGGALLIPAGFSQSRLSGGLSQLTVVTDPASAEGQSVYQALRVPVTQIMSTVEIASLDVDSMQAQSGLNDEERSAEFQAAYETASRKWDASDNDAMVVTVLAVAKETPAAFGGNAYNQSSPGMVVMFVIFGLVSSAQILVEERKSRTLERMLTTSISPAAVIAGHFLALFCLIMMQELLLVVFGQLALGVDYLRAAVGVLAVMVALAFCMASLGLLIGVYAHQEQQVTLYALIAMFLFSALGGTWFPLEVAGKAFSSIGHLTPSAWAMTGFQNILIRGLDSSAALLPSGILLLYAAGFFGIAVWRLRKEL